MKAAVRYSNNCMDGDMINLNETSYEEFGKLRFLDFFPKREDYEDDDVGGVECAIGHACCDGYALTAFCSKSGSGKQTSEIQLDFDNSCPEIEGNYLLDYLGLGLRRGMTIEQVKDCLGTPLDENDFFPNFLVGTRWPYYVGCGIHSRRGLFRVWIVRKDLWDILCGSWD